MTWYTWLEQGRDINASPQVLDAVARTLLLDPHERAHLFRLADAPDGAAEQDCQSLPPTVRALLDQLDPYPACVRNARLDILAWNDAYTSLMGDLGELPFEERNSLWLVFTSPRCRGAMLDWQDSTRRLVAEYRAAMAEHLAEPAWKCLVTRLSAASPEFAELWERHEIAAPENLTKRYLHPEVGLLQLNYTHLWLGQRLGTRMTTYTPAGARTPRPACTSWQSCTTGAAGRWRAAARHRDPEDRVAGRDRQQSRHRSRPGRRRRRRRRPRTSTSAGRRAGSPASGRRAARWP